MQRASRLTTLHRQAYEARHRSLGLCLYCSNPAKPGRTMCIDHTVKNAEKKACQRKSRIGTGLCGNCGRSTPPEAMRASRCPFCLGEKL